MPLEEHLNTTDPRKFSFYPDPNSKKDFPAILGSGQQHRDGPTAPTNALTRKNKLKETGRQACLHSQTERRARSRSLPSREEACLG